MGQRHQFLVVANIGVKFRPLTAVHHQWLYAESALLQCRRLLSIFEETANRIPLTQELTLAHRQTDTFWTASNDQQPFPFINTCVLVGTSFDATDNGFYNTVRLLEFNISLEQIDNDDGISVIDITDLENIKYCFAFPKMMRSRVSGATLLRKKPLTSGAHLRRYYDREGSKRWGRRVRSFNGYGLIDDKILQDIWADEATIPIEEALQEKGVVGTLSDRMMDRVIGSAVQQEEFDFDSLSVAQWYPGFSCKLRNKLTLLGELNELSVSSNLGPLFEMAFPDESAIDISHFRGLAAEQIIQIILHFLKCGVISSLDLSHLHQLSEKDIKTILSQKHQLEILYLLNMPQISGSFVSSISIEHYSTIQEIYHTEKMSGPLGFSRSYSILLKDLQSPAVKDIKSSQIQNIFWARISS